MKDTSSTDSSTKSSSSYNNNNQRLSTSSPSSNRKIVVMAKDNASRETQLKIAKSYIEKELKLGEKWYLLSKDWFSHWAAYIGLDETEKLKETPPEKINNRKLFEIDHRSPVTGSQAKKLKLREGLVEDIDFVTIPKEIWSYLVDVYSVESQDDIIEREVIDDSMDGLDGDPSNLKIEIWPLQVHMELFNNKEEPTKHTQEMSRQTKLDKIIERMKTLFNVPINKKVQLYFRPPNETSAKMTQVNVQENSTLMTASYAPDDTIVMRVLSPEETNETSSCCSTTRSVAIPPAPVLPTASLTTTQLYPTTRNSSQMASRYQNNGVANERRGLCGLSNLGNTCFMNSALQCMSNVPLLTDYFTSLDYKAEINIVNPLGRHGEIAEAYANLVSEIWSGNNSYVIPRQFKLAISKFAPQFTGYQQQDSQELLAFLLDGLHEDLNRVLKKPYVELGSHVGKTDDVFAEESWNDHMKRNDSVIVDIFHGLLKSTLNCLVCQEISIKFDPFCYLSVPLPSKKERLIQVIFVPQDPNQPLLKCKLAVLRTGTIQDLVTSMEKLLENDASITNKVPRTRMVVCDVYSNKFFKIFEPNDSIHPIKERDDIYIYELESNYNNNDYLKIKLHMREKTSSHSTSMSCFGLPFFFTVPREGLTYGLLYQYCFRYLSRFLKNTTEDINLNLNKNLNVKDEPISSIDQDGDATNGGDNSNNESEEDTESRSMLTRQSAMKANAKKPFMLHVSKSDNVDYDSGSSLNEISDETPFEWPASNNYSFSSSQTVYLCADFTPALLKRFYKGPRSSDTTPNTEWVHEHPSCQTTQLIKQRKDVYTLNECFTLYTKMEELSGQDYWYCSKCKAHQASTKKFDLWKLPPVLVVHLKRFSYDRMYRDKIDTLVDFPITDLDMAPYLINKKAGETKYNLIGVSNHYGSLGGGHYTAYCKNRCDGKWYYFDDSSVSASDETHVCTPAAYMLIYLRRDLYDAKIGTSSVNRSNLDNMEDGPSRSSGEKMDH